MFLKKIQKNCIQSGRQLHPNTQENGKKREKTVKILSNLVTSFVLSMMLAGQAHALQDNLPVNNINSLLELKVSKPGEQSLEKDGLFKYRPAHPPVYIDRNEQSPGKTYSMPDCLCHLHTRVI